MSIPDAPTIEQLLGIIEQQAALIGALEARISELEAEIVRLRQSGPGPSAKPPVTGSAPSTLPSLPSFVKPNRPKRTKYNDRKHRRQRDVSFSRARSEPTCTLDHALERCPDCGRKLCGGWLHGEREVIDIPTVAVEVVRHRFIARRCGVCRKRQLPKRAEVLSGVALGPRRFGIRLISLIAQLANVCRLPVRTIKQLLGSLFGLSISEGGIVALLAAVAKRGRRMYEDLQESVRSSPFVHADETGWREDGMNGYLWSFSTPDARLFLRSPSRGHQVPEKVLGSAYAGIVVSDFYSAYSYHRGPHQRCWVHLLRDLKQLLETFPDDPSVKEWAKQVHALYADATSRCYLRRQDRVRAREGFQERAVALALLYRKTGRPQDQLAERLYRFSSELFTFVQHPHVPSDNNAAERAIRPAVVARKVSGGTRSTNGSEVRATLMSLFGTWTLRGQDPLSACQQMLNENA
jgi:transposase